jgi:hypothetical protein
MIAPIIPDPTKNQPLTADRKKTNDRRHPRECHSRAWPPHATGETKWSRAKRVWVVRTREGMAGFFPFARLRAAVEELRTSELILGSNWRAPMCACSPKTLRLDSSAPVGMTKGAKP